MSAQPDSPPPRKRTPARVINNRARHRATALLLEEFQPRFRFLLDQERRVATTEAAVLLLMGEPDDDNVVLLRPGARADGQGVTDRVDTARCRKCWTSHDAGHVCPECGA